MNTTRSSVDAVGSADPRLKGVDNQEDDPLASFHPNNEPRRDNDRPTPFETPQVQQSSTPAPSPRTALMQLPSRLRESSTAAASTPFERRAARATPSTGGDPWVADNGHYARNFYTAHSNYTESIAAQVDEDSDRSTQEFAPRKRSTMNMAVIPTYTNSGGRPDGVDNKSKRTPPKRGWNRNNKRDGSG